MFCRRISFRNFHSEKHGNMNNVSSMLARKGSVVTVTPDTSVLEAIKIMSEKNIGSVVVMDNEKYLGIMSERDYSRKVALKGKSSTETTVSDIMSTDLPAVKPDDSVDHCMELMTEKNVRYMPVFADNKLTGIISMSDVVKQMILAQKETIHHLQNYIDSNV